MKNRTVNYRERIHRANKARFGEPQTMDELGHWIVRVAQYRGFPVVGLSWDLRYHPRVSNSHSSPVNGQTNLGQREDLPKGYPGWTGRVWIRYANSEFGKHYGSDALNRVQTYTGSGGYGSYDGPWEGVVRDYFRQGRSVVSVEDLKIYSYHYRIFEDDWPAVCRWREQQSIMKTLQGQDGFLLSHDFLWTDPETRKQDRKYSEQITENKEPFEC